MRAKLAPKRAVVRSDTEIARKRQAEARTGGNAVDGCERRDRERGETFHDFLALRDERLQLVGAPLGAQRRHETHVTSAAKRLARTG